MMGKGAFAVACCLVLLCSFAESSERRSTKARCYNGVFKEGECVCRQDYVGTYCELKMHCEGFDRSKHGYCRSCETGWTSRYCELIDCGENGFRVSSTRCRCNPPYSGQFCTEQTTKNVYLYYNRLMYSWGPVGCIIVVPLCLFMYCCRRDSERRQKRRIIEAIAHSRKTTIIMSTNSRSNSSEASCVSDEDFLLRK
ncbi:hypothetical protein L596_024717 [Steinernema carpocapsae]|uniref:EGF-like domain-containing protein n=1 Tax=Steinernema carpocapsae TaxID=34508 RepID=A0A4U5M5L3_STECR|nr:hypothetical protein L596_024717 [Steinernema carpocapsae]